TRDDIRDATPDLAGQPKGRRRYIRKALSVWRRDHPRPSTPAKDLEQPINLKSPQQLSAAITAYLAAERQRLGLTRPLRCPESLNAKVIAATMGTMPDAVNQTLWQPLLAYKK